jgi:hypothetical protein
MTVISSALFLAPAVAGLPSQVPPASSIVALAALGIINTGLACWLFYLLIDEAGATAASVIAYIMPVVALILGVGLGEKLSIGRHYRAGADRRRRLAGDHSPSTWPAAHRRTGSPLAGEQRQTGTSEADDPRLKSLPQPRTATA